VLRTEDAFGKAAKTLRYAAMWQHRELTEVTVDGDEPVDAVPVHPARPTNVRIVPPHKAKQGSRKAFVHR
jgi:hypothetical protein